MQKEIAMTFERLSDAVVVCFAYETFVHVVTVLVRGY